MSNRLEGKVAIIAGATAGIGKAMAKLFAAEGAKVVFTGRREDKGKAIEAEIKEDGNNALFIKADSTKREDIDNVVNETIKQFGKIDILCNNGGILCDPTPTEKMSMTDNFDRTMNTNLRATVEFSQAVLPHMLKAGKGSIVNTASVGADQALPMYVSYATSKAAVKHLTRSMAKEYASRGIRINCIQPGLTTSEMVPVSGSFEQTVLPAVAIGRTAKPEEMAYGALYLASDEASYCCGTCLLIDGGLL